METHFYRNKQKLCFTDNADFSDFQGIGKDPLYLRYDSLDAVLQNVEGEYRSFFALPSYSAEEGRVYWFCDEWGERPVRYPFLSAEDRKRYGEIKDKVLAYYKSVLEKLKSRPEKYKVLAAALKYVDENFLYCFDGKVVLVAWGMCLSPMRKPGGLVVQECLNEERFLVRFDCGQTGKYKKDTDGFIRRKKGFELTKADLPRPNSIECQPGYIFIGWMPNPVGLKVNSDMCFQAQYAQEPSVAEESSQEEQVAEGTSEPSTHTVRFSAGEDGRLLGEASLEVEDGHVLDAMEIPDVESFPGKSFLGWHPDTANPVCEDCLFEAMYEDKKVKLRFDVGDSGVLEGDAEVELPYGTVLPQDRVPGVRPGKGQRFKGWDGAVNEPLTEDVTWHALYEKEPWYKRFWEFMKREGWKWLLWILGLLLLLMVLLFLLRSCNSCSRTEKKVVATTGEVLPIRRDTLPDGRIVDDNGAVRDIVDGNGNLPENIGVAPIVGDDGAMPPIIENPGAPSLIANRLNIYFEDADVDMDRFARDFKQVYPDNAYMIVGGDRKARMLQIQIPESDRNRVREEINAKLPGYAFFVVDESLFESYGADQETSASIGWHLDAIGLRDAWKITMGSPEIVVAVVDDGFDASHPMLAGKITKPYNVFTQDNHLSEGEGHGTHVAALAVGNDAYAEKGVAGVAPDCLLMPVQVFDNGLSVFSVVTNGIMYAIHEGADVVNVSLGPSFKDLALLPEEQQEEIARVHFKNEEKVWQKVIALANERNCVLVFAVGNDRILASIPPELRTDASLNVAAVGLNMKATEFSNYGEAANISAPGEAIWSAFPDGRFQAFDGTSMAAPIVSGGVALMKSLNRHLTVGQIIACFEQTGRSVSGDIGKLLQIDKALVLVENGEIPEAEPVGNPLEEGAPDGSMPDGGSSQGGNGEGNGLGQGGLNPVMPAPGVQEGNPKDEGNPVSGQEDGIPGRETGTGNEDAGEAQEEKDSYAAIRKLIEMYKKKIEELEKLLPENSNKQ